MRRCHIRHAARMHDLDHWRADCGGLACCWLLWPKTPEPLRASLVAEAAPADTSGFARAGGTAAVLAFPADHGPHDDFQTEWWYYTGNLTAETGEHFGYQLTFFRRALTPPDQRSARDSAWAADQVYMAHLALTDVSGGKHYSFEKLARGAAGLAGAQAEPFRVWLEDWSVAGPSAGQTRLRAAAKDPASGLDLSLDLNLADLKGPILQGDRATAARGRSRATRRTTSACRGSPPRRTVTVGGKPFTVDGLSWMDHEWSTSALGAEQAGWDWFSIQLDDNTELMLFQLRRADGSVDGFSSGTLIAADGSTRHAWPRRLQHRVHRSLAQPAHRRGEYPAGWMLTVPSADLRLNITPWLADQEMEVSQKYWEGAVKAEGTRNGQPVAGNGYVELTGYAGSMQGQF